MAKHKNQTPIFIAPRNSEVAQEDKKEMRKEIDEQVKSFLKNGGHIEKIEIGVHKEHRTLKERQDAGYSISESKKLASKDRKSNWTNNNPVNN